MRNPQVDHYLIDGCGRCAFYATDKCKVRTWPNELELLRELILQTELVEELKWGVPCYTFNGKNVIILAAFKHYASINFFKGALLKDTNAILHTPGENSQASRVLKFTSQSDILNQEVLILDFIRQAIDIEKEGRVVAFKKEAEPLPEELIQVFAQDLPFKAAFEKLTPGRQRGYLLFFSQPKQSQTRFSRIEKCMDKIFAGKGLNDR